MIDLNDFKTTILPILKDAAADLWDGPEDTEFLKSVAEDMATLTAMKVAGNVQAAKEMEIMTEIIRQRAAQKQIRLNGVGEKTFYRVVSVIGRIALTLL